jgi:hypothetical protein
MEPSSTSLDDKISPSRDQGANSFEQLPEDQLTVSESERHYEGIGRTRMGLVVLGIGLKKKKKKN